MIFVFSPKARSDLSKPRTDHDRSFPKWHSSMMFPHHILAQKTFHQVLRLLKKAQPWSLSLKTHTRDEQFSGSTVGIVEGLWVVLNVQAAILDWKKLREISHVVRWFSIEPTIYRRLPYPQTANFHGKALLTDVFPHLHHVFDLGPHSALSTRPVGFPRPKKKKQILMGISKDLWWFYGHLMSY